MATAAAAASAVELRSHAAAFAGAGLSIATAESALWEQIVHFTEASAEKGVEAVEWGSQLTSALNGAGESLPSPGLAQALVSYICWSGCHLPAAWKYVELALSAGLAPPILVLALFSVRIPPYRRSRPSAYMLYMEIIKRHVFKLAPEVDRAVWKRTIFSVDAHLHLSETFGIPSREPGSLVVEFVFCIVWQLVDASLDDEGLLELTPEKKSRWLNEPQDMAIDGGNAYEGKTTEFSEKLSKANTVTSIEVVAMLLEHKLISGLLCLARRNMRSHWKIFAHHLQLLATNSSALRNSAVPPNTFLLSTLPTNQKLSGQRSQYQELQAITSLSLSSLGGLCHGASHSSLWIPLDIYLEDCMDASVAATSAIEIMSSLVKALRAINRTTWHDTFLGLWVAALRLVQRERDPIEGPVPHVDARLCLLLSITTLSIADIIREEEADVADSGGGERRRALTTSIQALGDYEYLLVPPQCLVSAANQASTKAMLFISEFNFQSEMALDCAGNMRHLIVEACIARNLLETTAYYWPGYVAGRLAQPPHASPGQGPGWSTLMKGAPLTPPMVDILVKTPASSLGELEKMVQIASSGSDDDRISAASILCGASLIRGWNFQEYTVRFVVKLLSPSIPVDYSGTDSGHLMRSAPVLFVILAAISSIDCVQVFSFHGLVPELAGALMAICEFFGSCVPSSSWTLPSGEEVTAHAVFSNAFVLLLRLWKFNHPPLEYCIMGDDAPVGSQLTADYLLHLRNAYVLERKPPLAPATHTNPIFVASFPKLKTWYVQHQACLASTLSGPVPGTPVHRNVDLLLGMMFRKLSRGNQPSAGVEDASSGPRLAAWEIMEAVPFAVDAALTACSHSKLSPRELATGLKDLADFLPASLGTIVSYFSAEVTRGVWEPAFMNGTDWPSPAANLSSVEDHIKKIVADTGVDVPSLVTGSSRATLPLPLAAFVSLTITYKLDSASVRFLDMAGPAMENLAASCPWPSMAIVAALWTKKVKRWSDFLTFSASRTVFHHNNDAVVQLLRTCFHATLAGGVGALLGHGFGSPVAPGVLYLRSYRCIKDILRLADQILSLLVSAVKTEAKPQASLVSAMAQVRVAAALASSLAWLAGGSRAVQSLFQEMLPSWFLCAREGAEGEMLEGYAVAYFAAMCGMFAWGGTAEVSRKRRRRVLRAHLEFLGNALDGRISLGCGWATWRGYVVGFLGVVVDCAPSWVEEVDPRLLRRICAGLQRWGEHELAWALLERGGVPAMAAAADLLISISHAS